MLAGDTHHDHRPFGRWRLSLSDSRAGVDH
jgi:hypothetical protein